MFHKLKRTFSSVALLGLVFLQISSTAMALTVSDPTSIDIPGASTNYSFQNIKTVTDSFGNIHMVVPFFSMETFQEGLLYYKYTASATSWGSGVAVQTADLAEDHYKFSIALDSSGNPAIAYTNNGTGNGNGPDHSIIYAYSTNGGLTFSNTTIDDTITDDFTIQGVAIGFFANDYPYVATSRSYVGLPMENYLTTYSSTDGSAPTTKVNTDVESLVSNDLAMVLQGTNTINIFGSPSDSGSFNKVYYYKSTNGGTSFAVEGQEVATGIYAGTDNGSSKIKASVDSASPSHVQFVVSSNNNGSSKLVYNRQQDDGSWTASSQVNIMTAASTIHSTDFGFDLDSSDVQYVTYYDFGATPTLKYAYSDDNGSTWTPATVDNTSITRMEDQGMANNGASISKLSNGEMMIVANGLGGDFSDFPTSITKYFQYYSLTSGGGGGGAVPEFSTWMMLLTIATGVGFVYGKYNPEFVNE